MTMNYSPFTTATARMCVKWTVLSIMQHKSPENNFDFHLNNISSEDKTPIFLDSNTTTHVHILIQVLKDNWQD